MQLPEAPSRFNVAPSQTMPIVIDQEGRLVVIMAVWGFRPRWARADMRAQINARSESMATKPYFRDAYRRYRCLVPADGWYEWQQAPTGKVPHFIHRKDDAVFAFAGLWSGDINMPSFTIITCAAQAKLKWLHDRMPYVLNGDQERDWLEVSVNEHSDVRDTMNLETITISQHVNSPINDDEECIKELL